MRNVRRALASAALLGAAVTAGPAMSAGAQSEEPEVQLPAPSGYWLVGADGGIFTYGEAGFHGSMGGERINEPVVGMAATVSGAGYWEVALDGGIFSFGDAAFHGSMGDKDLNAPMVGIAATPEGGGYWTVATDGGVFSFGDAVFYGAMGSTPLAAPVVGIVPTPTGEGYWLVAEDGGVFAFGDAPFYGSLGDDPLDEPIVGLAASGDGYVTVTALGRIDAFGAPEVPGIDLDDIDSPIVAVANDANSEGFWVTEADGTVHALEGAHHWGDADELALNAPMVAIASVAPDSQAPMVAGDVAGVGQTSVTFTANEPLDPASVGAEDVTEDADAAVTNVALGGGGATITVTFDGPLALGDTVTLAASSVEDLAGNVGPADAAVVTVADITGPVVIPGEAAGTTATFIAGEPLDPDTVDEGDVTTTSEAAITEVALNVAGTTITVTFDAPLEDGDTVTLAAGSVADVAGNAGPAADVVATVADGTAPSVVVGVVGEDTVTFLADEDLDPESVESTDVSTTSDAGIDTVVLEADGTTITVTLDAPLEDGDTVTLTAGSVEDLAGNAGPAANVVATAALDAVAPFIASATAIDNGDGEISPADGGAFPTNDSWTIVFSEAVTPASAEDAQFVVSGGGLTGTFICNSSGCSLSSDGMTLTVNVLGLPVEDPDEVPFVPVPNIDYPATITGFSTGAAPVDLAGNPVNLAAPGSDNVINAVVLP